MEQLRIPFDDPNLRRNRVPEDTELVTLRALVSSNERILHTLDHELEDGSNRYSEIRRRYDNQLRILEGVKSELYAAAGFVNVIQNQRDPIRRELNKLRQLLHPIRRCPSDVLQYLFEWAVSIDEDIWLRCATNISQVCQRWREVALQTPFLWHRIRIPFDSHPDQVEIFWKRMTSRIQTFPPQIILDGITWSENGKRILSICKLNQFPLIKNLHFSLHTTEMALFNNAIELPTGQVDRLVLVGTVECETGEIVTPIDEIISKFTTTSTVVVGSLSSSPFKPGRSLAHVVDLSIRVASLVSLVDYPHTFPNAQRVLFSAVNFTSHDDSTITWPSVRSLSVEQSEGTPWRHLKVPAIDYFRVNVEEKNDLDEFFSSHPALQKVSIVVRDFSLSSILKAAPNLKSASINLSACGIGSPEPLEFKCLHVLCLYYEDYHNDFSVESLEKIVASYVLPNINKYHRDDDRSFTLQIYVSKDIYMKCLTQLGMYKSYLLLTGASVIEETKPSEYYLMTSYAWS